jgi:hypothetical protein
MNTFAWHKKHAGSHSACPATEEELPQAFQARFMEAQKHGWLLGRNALNTGDRCFPPKESECNGWAEATFTLRLGETTIDIPHWFWDDSVMRTGMRTGH